MWINIHMPKGNTPRSRRQSPAPQVATTGRGEEQEVLGERCRQTEVMLSRAAQWLSLKSVDLGPIRAALFLP